jgi:tRNA (guanine-N7-)-methyltransferase
MRPRKHCNPLGFQGDVARPDWRALFAHQPDAPMEVDVGYGMGGFLLERAAARPDLNIVGLEVRRILDEKMRETLAQIEPGSRPNLHIILCNANWSFDALFDDDSLSAIHVYFPDPWFKLRHHKRRVMNDDFAAICLRKLKPGGLLLAKSDVPEVAAQIRTILDGVVAASHAPAEPEAAHAEAATHPFAGRRLTSLAAPGHYVTEEAFPVAEKSSWERHLIRAGKPYDRMAYRREV